MANAVLKFTVDESVVQRFGVEYVDKVLDTFGDDVIYRIKEKVRDHTTASGHHISDGTIYEIGFTSTYEIFDFGARIQTMKKDE